MTRDVRNYFLFRALLQVRLMKFDHTLVLTIGCDATKDKVVSHNSVGVRAGKSAEP